ncbi:hypothetical protein Hanom_Chr03g00184321 [Helianthus anomalus]
MFDPGRILPKWSQFNPHESLNRIVDIDYGITDGQKKRILNNLLGVNQAVKAIDQQNWVQGEWDFFVDKCTELGLDPDYCVEDVEEDESGTAQFITQLAKAGKYFDPVVSKATKNKKVTHGWSAYLVLFSVLVIFILLESVVIGFWLLLSFSFWVWLSCRVLHILGRCYFYFCLGSGFRSVYRVR